MFTCNISVIIPVYNAENYISELMERVIAQKFQNFEVIIMDDGSTDSSKKIIEEYIKKDARVRCYSQKNQGLSATRNNALQYANGEYVAFIDADDLISEDYLQKLYDATEGWKDTAVCSYCKFDSETGKVLYDRYTEDWNITFSDGNRHVFQDCPWARIIRMDFIRKYNLLFSVGEQLEDIPYCMALGILANDVGIVNSIEYYYRSHSQSIMGKIKTGGTPKIPYSGFEEAINTVLQSTEDEKKKAMLEFCALKNLTGWLTIELMYSKPDVHKQLSNYCYRIIDNYFPEIFRNRYLTSKTTNNKLPFYHRVSVILMVISYKLHIIYPFSYVIRKILRLFDIFR